MSHDDSEIASVNIDVARVNRNYAMMRLEHIGNVQDAEALALICETELDSISASFHEAQRRVFLAMKTEEQKQEFQVTMEFEELLLRIKMRLPRKSSFSSLQSPKAATSEPLASAKLPRIHLRTFDGKVENWLPFIEIFDSLIHNKQNIDDVAKLHYLLSSLTGEPLDLVKSFPLCSASYADAYKKIKEKYNRPRQLANVFFEKIMSCESVKRSSSTELKRLEQTFTENLAILEKQGLPDKNFMLVYLLWSKLDNTTRIQFELDHNSHEIPKFDDLLAFLKKRNNALEVAGALAPSSAPKSKPTPNQTAFLATNQICSMCKANHHLTTCSLFLEKEPKARFNIVKEGKLCILCLSSEHTVKNCKSKKKCSICKYSHNTLLHFNKERYEAAEHASALASHVHGRSLLSTARAVMKDNRGCFVPVRVLLDSGSETNFISLSCTERLGLKKLKNKIPMPVKGIPSAVERPVGVVSCIIKSNKEPSKSMSFDASIVTNLNNKLPSKSFSIQQVNSWKHLSNLPLADPHYNKSQNIDLILGSHVSGQCLLPGLSKGSGDQPVAINTVFGWVIIGGAEVSLEEETAHTFHVTSCPLEESLKAFWELENIPNEVKIMSPRETMAEKKFIQEHARTANGRYVVPLPFADPTKMPIFSHTRVLAYKRLLALERKFRVDSVFHESYKAFMLEYEQNNHMEKVDPPREEEGHFYYIPHHGILRDSLTTPLRVVFDASAKDSNSMSLNQALLEGPTLQTNIFNILSRFRWHKIVFIADLKQMYRQILVPDTDADYQRILWRKSPEEPIQDYRLVTVTYGIRSAPFQALRTVAQIAQDHKNSHPNASAVLHTDIYMDDVVTGVASVTEGLALSAELVDMFASAGFVLRKWCSNSEEFLKNFLSVSPDGVNFQPTDKSLKVLGLKWSPSSDSFSFNVAIQESRCTKRIILSEIARIFDPLGILSPLIFMAKYIIQLLWASGVSWDDEPPTDIKDQWVTIKSQLPNISAISVPRHLITPKENRVQLHGFCDASERGYCAVIYARSEDNDGNICVQLACGKSKVAPLKRVTLPRLELLAATLLSDLMHTLLKSLQPFGPFDVFAWSDSSVALTWIKSCPSKWKTFVSNRVSSIQDQIPPSCWKHVLSGDNPADCGSRGLTPNELVSHSLWWSGPEWLLKSEDNWPKFEIKLSNDVENEQKVCSLLATNDSTSVIDEVLRRFSSLRAAERVVAWCLRFMHNLKNRTNKIVGALLLSEIRDSLTLFVKHAQEVAFASEMQSLKKDKLNSLPKELRKLSPFVDERGLLRVGGRLANASIHYDRKHPLLLPRQHRLTTLIIDDYHVKYMHPGLQTLHHLLRQNFWILSSKRAIQSVVSACHRCFRCQPRAALAPLMGNLPSYRVSELKPFSVVCCDYGGPYRITLGRYRGAKAFKAYICVFVCTSVKAIHVELATELSTDAFLAALKRFIARRGRCTKIISDCGTNFIGAANSLKAAAEKEQIQFAFNPPGSPHFSGLAEAGIKSVKTHVARVIGLQCLTYEELYTLLAQIEAVLNSRPLTPLSSDVNDLSVLTPGHFLTMEPVSAAPEEDLTSQKISPLNRWKFIQKMHQDFWRRWHQEYIHSLQQRQKWNKSHPDVQIGVMVLLIDEQITPLRWRIGRIIALHPGNDGVCRVASVQTANGLLKRAIMKLCPLPIVNS